MSGRRRRGTSTTPARAGGQDPKGTRPGLVGAAGSEPLRTQGYGPSGGAEKGSSSSAPALSRDLTVVDEHLLECGVCFLPLKPPIFQCGVGHVLCSPCSEKLKDAGKCHLCGVAMPDGYQRCHAMEDMVNSIRGPCPLAPYGCDTTPVYHAREEHVRECPHSPCHCPGDGCSFVGSVTMVVEHLAAVHSWPCTAEPCANISFPVDRRDGFNFLTAVRGSAKYLLLLNVVTTPFGRAICAVSVGSLAATAIDPWPRASTRNTICDLSLTSTQYKHALRPRGQYYTSRCHVECPLDGMPDPNDSYQFFIPNYVGESEEARVHVFARIFIGS